MSSIGQGPAQTEQSSNSGPLTNEPVDYSDNSVRRGYSDQNSYSRTEADETVRSQVPKPRLDNPTPGAESDAAGQEVIRGFENSQESPVSEYIREKGRENVRKGLEKSSESSGQEASGSAPEARQKAGERSHTERQGTASDSPPARTGSSEGNSVPSGNTANTANGAETPAAANTAAAREAAAAAQGIDIPTLEEFDRFASTFKDVYVKVGAIKDAPPSLQQQIQAEFSSFLRKAINGQQPLDMDSATTMLVAIQSKLQDNRIRFDQETIKIRQVEHDQKFSESIGKIRESIQEAKKAKQSALIGKIFGWLAVVVMIIVTIVVAVVSLIPTILSGGAAGGFAALALGLMITAIAVTITQMASQEAGSTWMMDIFGDSKDAKIGAMVFWTALVMALSIGGAAAGGVAGAAAGAGGNAAASAANTASSGTSAGATATATAANSAATGATMAAKATKIASYLTKALQLIAGASMVGDGSAQIATSVYNYNAENLRAEAMEDRAFMLRLQQAIDDATESIAQAIDELQAGYQVAANIIKADHETKTNLLSKLKA